VFPALKEQVQASPVEQARRLFYDTLVFDAATLAHLVAQFGATQLMVGTDYPFNFHEHAPLARVEAASLGADVANHLIDGNARRFLARAFASTKH